MNKTISETRTVKIDISQGTVVGPLLFNVCTNELTAFKL